MTSSKWENPTGHLVVNILRSVLIGLAILIALSSPQKLSIFDFLGTMTILVIAVYVLIDWADEWADGVEPSE